MNSRGLAFIGKRLSHTVKEHLPKTKIIMLVMGQQRTVTQVDGRNDHIVGQTGV